MTSYEDAVKMIMEKTETLGPEERSVASSVGHVSAEDVYSDINLPQTAISGPDGYAVRADDIGGANRENPAALRITGSVRAGQRIRKTVRPGTAMRIMTGSVIPDGADCVVRFEDTDEPWDKNGPNNDNPSMVNIYVPGSLGDNIRHAGSNLKKGAMVMPKGTIIGPSQISALTAIGRTGIRVIRRPVVAIIATGDELVNTGRHLAGEKCYNSNTAAVASLVTHYGGIPRVLGIARDKEDSIISKLQKGMSADAIITTGGVSKGDYDMVRLAIGKIGEMVFSRIKMAPGASMALGIVRQQKPNGHGEVIIPVFALAGPPVGCLINFELLTRPALLKMRGLSNLDHPSVEAMAVDSIPRTMPMSFVLFTSLKRTGDGYQVTLDLMNRIGVTAAMATANSLTVIPEGTEVKKGDMIRVLPLDWCSC